jgi:hypothetical protein
LQSLFHEVKVFRTPVSAAIEDPDHLKEMIAQRKKARCERVFMRFAAICPEASGYCRELRKRRMNPRHHVVSSGERPKLDSR